MFFVVVWTLVFHATAEARGDQGSLGMGALLGSVEDPRHKWRSDCIGV